MKYELKELVQAMERAKKDGAVRVQVSIDTRTSKIAFQYESIDNDIITISIAEADSELWNEIETSKRFT